MNICKEHDCPDICCWPHKKPEKKGGLNEIQEALAVIQTRSYLRPQYLWMDKGTLKYLINSLKNYVWGIGENPRISIITTGIFDEPRVVTFLGLECIVDDFIPNGLVQIACQDVTGKQVLGTVWL